MKLIKEDDKILHVQCTLCKKGFTVKKEECTKTTEGYQLHEKLKCPDCSQEDVDIIDYDKMLKKYNSKEKQKNIQSFENEKIEQIEKSNSESQIKCSKCGSTQITSDSKKFSVGKSVAGAVLFGGMGLLGGLIGSKKVIITCLKCGHQWKAGE